ncbi:flagellar hook-associated protein 1 FlgK [Pelagirhabdus alkalitolerans]|uniref:Flagellar hook-associated protein 1 n=1 Tax=Pelagirhabdus alkalitolerans TaxID=1612202 RepID=A0A1G6L4H4_9BACI|nr:flagellar hook-associated protein FlgK [Pelagirhabdus alkalitolerans]SDC38212.1 flagellar hook-associated protein 1 FlgK [Pelagirhabdus alkalitolerans]
MTSTFHGLEMAKRALSTQQAALYTTSHNISNANTDGYSRQRVNMSQINSMTSSREPGGMRSNVGSGVETGSIERIRDRFIDLQYRKEHGKVGYYEERAEAMNQMESIMNEPSDEGLSHIMDQFWDSIQDLSVNPEDSGARAVVAQRAEAVTDTFNYVSNSLEDIRGDLKGQMEVTESDFNSMVNQINAVNREIAEIEPHGNVPNDLYDERDRLLDNLSKMADINVTYEKSSGQPSDVAEGVATVTLNGVDEPVTLVDGSEFEVNHMHVNFDDNNDAQSFQFYNPEEAEVIDGNLVGDSTDVAAIDYASTGSMLGLMEMNGFGDGEGYYNEMLTDLDQMATSFAAEFNEIHSEGFDLNGQEGINDFFVFDGEAGAESIGVNGSIMDDPDLIAASASGDSGDGEHAIELAAAYTNHVDELGNRTSVKTHYESMIGQMGVVTQEAYRMRDNSGVLRQQVEENRDSVSAVSLDEEMTNMIKFQHAYNAAARSMTAVDETIDRIINNMGLVGR